MRGECSDRHTRMARLYALACLRLARRQRERARRLRRMEAGDGRLWPWPQWAEPDLTHEALLLCRRLAQSR